MRMSRGCLLKTILCLMTWLMLTTSLRRQEHTSIASQSWKRIWYSIEQIVPCLQEARARTRDLLLFQTIIASRTQRGSHTEVTRRDFRLDTTCKMRRDSRMMSTVAYSQRTLRPQSRRSTPQLTWAGAWTIRFCPRAGLRQHMNPTSLKW